MKRMKNKQETVYHSQSAEETFNIGKELSKTLQKGAILTLEGDLGAGKTTLMRGLVEGIHQVHSRDVCSPTFSYLNIYEGTPTIYHFDLYRLPSSKEFILAGFDEYFFLDGICCIEWPEKIQSILPTHAIHITILYKQKDEREVSIVRPL